jgi:hypothetical protein
VRGRVGGEPDGHRGGERPGDVGQRGLAARLEYAAVGDTTNIASRLRALTEGGAEVVLWPTPPGGPHPHRPDLPVGALDVRAPGAAGVWTRPPGDRRPCLSVTQRASRPERSAERPAHREPVIPTLGKEPPWPASPAPAPPAPRRRPRAGR